MLTRAQARLIMEAHDIKDMLDDVEELEAMERSNPALADAYCALHRIAYGEDPTGGNECQNDVQAAAGGLTQTPIE